jgi:alpha-ketoglutarate-dependent taurine dioxygenase
MSANSPLAHINYLQAAPRRRLVPLNPAWGVELRGFDLDGPLTTTLGECLRSLLFEHQVLFLRRCHLSQSRVFELARLLGEPEDDPTSVDAARMQRAPSMSFHPSARGYYRVLWQADASYRERPYAVAMLHSPVTAEACEKSFLSSAVLACESLPDPLREQLETMTAIHRADCQAHVLAHPARDDDAPVHGVRAEHPVLLRHPFTGRSYLNVNEAFTERIVGLPADQSRQLLELLTQQFYRPDHQVLLKWAPGSLAIWDPRTVQHYGPAQLDGSRTLIRVTSRMPG